MKRAFLFLLASALLIPLATHTIYACTTFCLKNRTEILFGKNYDWMIGDGMIFVNKRGVSKMSAEQNPAKWVSRYGSVTFNQYGWESPSGGMNEAGLVIELMWLDETQYPSADDRPALDVLEWIQFNLDTAAATDEVIRNAESVRISSSVKLHYLVNDKFGNTATIEFLDGKLVAHTGNTLPYSALTNDTYQRSVQFAKSRPATTGEGSLERFSRAVDRTKDFGKQTEKDAVDYAFDSLERVEQKSTQWSIVYDQRRGRIYFRTKKRSELKSIDTTALDYSCSTPVKVLDLDAKDSGEVTNKLRNLTRRANRDLIERSFNGTDFLKDMPNSTKDRFAEFPEHFACAAKGPVTAPVDSKSLIASAGVAGYLFNVLPLYYIFGLVSS